MHFLVMKHGYKTLVIKSKPCSIIINDILLVTLMTMRIIKIWCLQRFPPKAHSHVQSKYSINEHLWSKDHLFQKKEPYCKGFKNEWDQHFLFRTCSHNMFHNLLFYEPFFHFKCVHVMSCNCYYQFPNQPTNLTPFKTLCFKWKPMF
jgi:hypothetical protein